MSKRSIRQKCRLKINNGEIRSLLLIFLIPAFNGEGYGGVRKMGVSKKAFEMNALVKLH